MTAIAEIKSDVWSYSKVNSFPENDKDGCALGWKYTYIDGLRDKSEGNAFSEWGKAYHKTMEKFLKDEIFEYELADNFTKRVENIKYKFPYNKYVDLRESTYNGIIEHFEDLTWLEDYKILSVEKERRYKINGVEFVSIADLEVERIKSNKLGIVDHKLSKPWTKKETALKVRQLYTYSYPFKEEYGRYPDELIFNHYKTNKIIVIEFNLNDYKKSIDWLMKKIDFIKNQNEFPARCELVEDKASDWYATKLCNYRFICPHSSLCNKEGAI